MIIKRINDFGSAFVEEQIKAKYQDGLKNEFKKNQF